MIAVTLALLLATFAIGIVALRQSSASSRQVRDAVAEITVIASNNVSIWCNKLNVDDAILVAYISSQQRLHPNLPSLKIDQLSCPVLAAKILQVGKGLRP